jgi:predicted nucleic acid-binding protein
MIICDTNILIHAFNGDSRTIEALQSIGYENIALSSVTVMELYQGMANKQELAQMKKKIKYFDIIQIDTISSKLAISLIEKYRLSNGLAIPDALIAASAIVVQLELFTYNLKDFSFIPDLKLFKV